MNDITVNTNIDLQPVIIAVINEVLKPVNDWALEMAKDGRLTQEDVDALYRKVMDVAEVVGPAVEEKLKGVEWITADSSYRTRIHTRISWNKRPRPQDTT